MQGFEAIFMVHSNTHAIRLFHKALPRILYSRTCSTLRLIVTQSPRRNMLLLQVHTVERDPIAELFYGAEQLVNSAKRSAQKLVESASLSVLASLSVPER